MGGEKLEGSRHLPHTATTAASSMACSLPGPRGPAATVGAQSVHHIMSQDTGELFLRAVSLCFQCAGSSSSQEGKLSSCQAVRFENLRDGGSATSSEDFSKSS